MKRKWIVLASVALVLGALVTVAVAEHGEKTWAHALPMLGHLDLTDEQKEQLQKLREEQRGAMAAMRERLKELREKHVEALREQREEYRKALEDILTDEQRANLRPHIEMWAPSIPEHILRGEMWVPSIPEHMLYGEHLESIKESIGNVRGSIEYWNDMRGIERTFAKLDLTDEQKEQLKELRKEQREEFYKWRRKQRQAMENILTDEQREKLEMLKDEAFYGSKYGAFR